jgi:endoglucanase
MRVLLLTACLLAGATAAESPVPALATEARIFLQASGPDFPARDLSISRGSASISGNKADLSFPCHWWKWQETTLSFTPQSSGSIQLILSGTWQEARKGVLKQMATAWDGLSATGAQLRNGGFEEGGPDFVDWTYPWGKPASMEVWPWVNPPVLSGKRAAVTWHNQPLAQTLEVKAGVPVTLTFSTRSIWPSDEDIPRPLAGSTPAHEACAKLKRGINLGNSWEAPPNTWGLKFTTEDIDEIAAQGFDHIRVPVAWQHYLKDGSIDPALLAKLLPVLERAREKHLRILLDWHGYDEVIADPEAHRDAFIRGWRIIAEYFRSWSNDDLYFELLNEPNQKLSGKTLNDLYRDTIAAIRPICPERILVVGPSGWCGIGSLDALSLPANDPRLIVTVHSYEPFPFTHQGASWVQLEKLRGIQYPGPPATPLSIAESPEIKPWVQQWIRNYNEKPTAQNPSSPAAFIPLLDDAAAWSQALGRPIHLGEFGAFQVADLPSRQRYVHDVRTAAEARHIPWMMWEWKAGFKYWDPETKKAVLKEALFSRE